MTGMLLLLLLGYWPLPANYGITGTFMEYRNQHLHAGFDLSTEGKTGFPVRCFDDGNVVLIKVQKRGYGRVLYIRHPKRKLVSVYGHLNRFTPRIEELVSRYKKLRHSRYPGTIVPEKPIPVQKGQIIAYSGESGVGWPHLHFELRNLRNEPVNPAEFGLSVDQDKSAPEFQFLNIYPETPVSTVNGSCTARRLPISRLKNGHFTIKPFHISGHVLMSLTIRDTDGRKGPLAVHLITARLNQAPFYRYHADVFSYDRFNRSSAVYDLSTTRLSPSTYGFNLFRIPGANLCSQESFPAYFQEGRNQMRVLTVDFSGHKAVLDFQFNWQKPRIGPIPQNAFTTAALLTDKQVIPASLIHTPLSIRIKGQPWHAISYGPEPGGLKLGNVSIEANGYNTSPKLLYVRSITPLPEERGLKRIPQTGIEVQPGQIFLSQLRLSFRWVKSDLRMGWFRYDTAKKKWKYRNSELNQAQGKVIASDFRNGQYAVFLDIAAPEILKNPFYFHDKTAWHIIDVGKGVDDSTILISRGKQKWNMEYDPDRKIAWVDTHLPKGPYKISVTDLAGNLSTGNGTLQ